MRKIILASSSLRRSELLKKYKIDFIVEPSDFDEENFKNQNLSPIELVKILSFEKAKAVFEKHKNEDFLIVGVDTIVVLKKKILGKPHTEENAYKMLKLLSGKVHKVISGFTVIDAKNGGHKTDFCTTKVWFKNLSDEKIWKYIKTGEPLDKAGSYAIQGFGRKFIKKFRGDYDNVVGMPVKKIKFPINHFSSLVEKQKTKP